MSHTAVVITVAYAIAVAIGLLLAAAVWRSTWGRRGELEVGRVERREKTWFVAVLAGLVALLFGTIFLVPYGTSAAANAQVVRVTGFQFAWAIDPSVVKAKRQVAFYLTSTDVNHGFGVYDSDGVLQFQAQVVPGRTQKVVHTFSRPGKYRVLCLEFCGVGHHEMVASFQVKA